mmetsp:Transcript_59737/g.122565  ORF Transcript_59737/g.122565 Transcript_59737/m.122565 type:complete len:296 (-) Transcript_59737:46-933(-)
MQAQLNLAAGSIDRENLLLGLQQLQQSMQSPSIADRSAGRFSLQQSGLGQNQINTSLLAAQGAGKVLNHASQKNCFDSADTSTQIAGPADRRAGSALTTGLPRQQMALSNPNLQELQAFLGGEQSSHSSEQARHDAFQQGFLLGWNAARQQSLAAQPEISTNGSTEEGAKRCMSTSNQGGTVGRGKPQKTKVDLYPRRKKGEERREVDKQVVIDEKALRSLFHLRLKDAAAHLGICQNSVKTACRKLGIERWPYENERVRKRKLDGGKDNGDEGAEEDGNGSILDGVSLRGARAP